MKKYLYPILTFIVLFLLGYFLSLRIAKLFSDKERVVNSADLIGDINGPHVDVFPIFETVPNPYVLYGGVFITLLASLLVAFLVYRKHK